MVKLATTLWANSSDDSSYLTRNKKKKDLTFHENCLRLHKMSKPVCWEKIYIYVYISVCHLLKILPRMLSVKVPVTTAAHI